MKLKSTDDIREILAKRIGQENQEVGIVAGLVEPDGRRVIAHGPQSDGDTIFEIGSITKVFTSLLLSEMVQRKEVAFADPASSYLPKGVTLPEAVTLRDLAMHTSGLPRVPDNLKPKDPLNPYADYRTQDLYDFLSHWKPTREPDSQFEYSNLGAGLLGHILERRSGTDYENLIRNRITDPLGMPDTGIAISPAMKIRQATGHNWKFDPVCNWDFDILAGAGALRSTANDMLTLLEAFLGYKESPLAPTMKAMLDVRRPVGKGTFEQALGWSAIGDTVWHDGGTGGFCSFAAFDPKARVGVVVLSNAFSPEGVSDIGMKLLHPSSPVISAEAHESRVTVDPVLLDRYTGRYQWGPDRVLEVTRTGDRLFVQTFAQVNGRTVTGPGFEIFPESETRFLVKVTNSHITFEPSVLVMQRPGREPERAERVG